MEKLSINLLPYQLRPEAKKSAKKTWIFRSSIIWLVLVLIITIAVFGFSLDQSRRLKNLNDEVENNKQQVVNFKNQEELTVLLKDRLDSIGTIINKESDQVKAFNLITALQPPDVTFGSFAADKSGHLKINGNTRSLVSLRDFFNGLTDPKQNEGKLSAVRIESLSKNLAGLISFELDITFAGDSAKVAQAQNK